MFKIHLKDTALDLSTPLVMGILNTTPDSFFEGSRMEHIDIGVNKAIEMAQFGASILDIGGQSTRPGAEIITESMEIERVVPMIEAIHTALPNMPISIDTFHASVAKAALDAGACIVNDISCGNFDPKMLSLVVAYQAGFIGMHQTGGPTTMHEVQERSDIMSTILNYFIAKKKQFADMGLTQWIVDPGFGFSKTPEQNFELISSLSSFKSFQKPLLIGVSRKSTIYKTLGITASDALNGTTVLHTAAILHGASILRVHDVKEANEVVTLCSYLQ